MDDASFIRRAIQLAMRGRGGVEPNPMVGCIIAKNRRIIGEGWHQQYGHAHAEPNALAACTESPQGATAYVTLEPCCHTKKQTPPCVPRLIAAQIARVVIGTVDPNPQVAGRGIQQLHDAGIIMETGVCAPSCSQLIAPYLVRLAQQRPYVTLKWAQTRDGKIAGSNGCRLQITGAAANVAVMDLRSRCDAILVGVNTVLQDDPLLTVRDREPLRPLRRMVLDRHLRTPIHSRLVRSAREHQTVIYCDQDAEMDREKSLVDAGVSVVRVNNMEDALRNMHGVTHLLVEPGPTLAAEFLRRHLADRIWIFQSDTLLNELTAPSAVELSKSCKKVAERDIGTDHLTEYLDTDSAAYFSAEPSADFRWIDPPVEPRG